MKCLPKILAGTFILLFVLALSATPLIAQDGYTPETAIAITAASSGEVYNSRRPTPFRSDSPESCGPYYPAPYYDEFWFKYSAAKDEKLVYFSFQTMLGQEQGSPGMDDFAAILFAYEQSESGLSQIGCQFDGPKWVLSIHPGRTYLFRVAALSSSPWGGDPIYLGHGGTITLYIESSPIGVIKHRGTTDWLEYFWGDGSEGLISVVATSPDFFCESATSDPVKWELTTIRNGTIHYTGHGEVYARVYRPSNFENAIDLISTEACAFLRITNWLVAEGMANWSWHDNNGAYSGGKSDTWGESVTGRLTDLTRQCPGGSTHLEWHYVQYATKGYDWGYRTLFGPKLSCDPKN